MTIAVFATLLAIWCLAGARLVSHHRVTMVIERWGHCIPAVYIIIGLYIFHEAGVLGG